MNIPKIFVAVDLETTGLEFDKDEIIEVALVRFEDGHAGEAVDFFVKPSLELRPFISHLTGIKAEALQAAEDFSALAPKLSEFIGELPLVAHNSNFDMHFLCAAFEKAGVHFDDHPVFDSLAISRIAFPEMPNHKLATLVAELGIQRKAAHRAAPDASAAGEVFLRSLAEIATWPPSQQAMLSKASAGTIWHQVLLFEEPCEPFAYQLENIPKVTPILRQELKMRAKNFFGEGGKLAKVEGGFVTNEDQRNFAHSVERNMYEGGIAVFEAPSDFGKPLAYLVPAAIRAASGERVVISVASRKLQKRLYEEELPLLKKIFGDALKPCILRSRNSYLCLGKLEDSLDDVENSFEDEERETVMTLVSWLARTKTGDISENAGFNYIRNRIVWNKLKSDSLICNAENNAEHFDCPANIAKRRAASSNLIFVDHEFFVSDMQLDFSLMPAYDHVIFDEAHLLPEISTKVFGRSVRFFDVRNLLKILVHPKDETEGLLAAAGKSLPAESELCTALRRQIKDTERTLHRFLMKLGKNLSKNKQTSFRYERNVIYEYAVSPSGVTEALAKLKGELEELIRKLRESGDRSLANRLEAVLSSLSGVASDFDFLVRAGRPEFVFSLEEPFNPHTIRLVAEPIFPGKVWAEKFYSRAKSSTFTSPVLSIKRNFNYFVGKMGMGEAFGTRKPFVRSFQDVPSKAQVAVAKFLPKPNATDFQKTADELLASVLPGLPGNALVLFLGGSAMLRAHRELSPAFAAKGKLLLCQELDGQLENLVEIFRKEPGACLLATQPFGASLDFPSEVLNNLIVVKLPFPSSSDPFVVAMSELCNDEGKNAFKDFIIPETTMILAREFSDLTKAGAKILFLDTRVIKEPYGKSFSLLWNFTHKVLGSAEDVKSFLA